MSKALNLVILISGTGRNLQAIIDAARANTLLQIKAVISNNPDAYGLKRAELAGIPAISIPHTDYATRAQFEAELMKCIDSFNPDWIVLAGFMRLLSEHFINRYPRRILNIHPSLLPKYPGLNTHAKVLANKELEHGASIHLVDHGLDSGPLICQARLQVNAHDTVESLQERVMALETQLYPQVLAWLASSRLVITENEIRLDGKIIHPASGSPPARE